MIDLSTWVEPGRTALSIAGMARRNRLLRFQNSRSGSFTPVNAVGLAVGSKTGGNTVAHEVDLALRMSTMR
jgi:hypothetical protein